MNSEAFPVDLGSGWRRTEFGMVQAYATADALGMMLGATHRHAIHLHGVGISSIAYLKDVQFDDRGYPTEALQVGGWTLLGMNCFTAFENPRRYISPIKHPEIPEPVEELQLPRYYHA